jgi:hypothetical protein
MTTGTTYIRKKINTFSNCWIFLPFLSWRRQKNTELIMFFEDLLGNEPLNLTDISIISKDFLQNIMTILL